MATNPSTSQPTAEQAHEFVAGYGSALLCGVVVNDRPCGRGKGAAIHRLVTDAPADALREFVESQVDLDGDAERILRQVASEPQAAPPPELKLCACGYMPSIQPCFDTQNPNWQVQCSRCGREGAFAPSVELAVTLWNQDRATADALAKALRGLATRFNRKDKTVGECWCGAWDWTKHSEACTAARTALASWEKGES